MDPQNSEINTTLCCRVINEWSLNWSWYRHSFKPVISVWKNHNTDLLFPHLLLLKLYFKQQTLQHEPFVLSDTVTLATDQWSQHKAWRKTDAFYHHITSWTLIKHLVNVQRWKIIRGVYKTRKTTGVEDFTSQRWKNTDFLWTCNRLKWNLKRNSLTF